MPRPRQELPPVAAALAGAGAAIVSSLFLSTLFTNLNSDSAGPTRNRVLLAVPLPAFRCADSEERRKPCDAASESRRRLDARVPFSNPPSQTGGARYGRFRCLAHCRVFGPRPRAASFRPSRRTATAAAAATRARAAALRKRRSQRRTDGAAHRDSQILTRADPDGPCLDDSD